MKKTFTNKHRIKKRKALNQSAFWSTIAISIILLFPINSYGGNDFRAYLILFQDKQFHPDSAPLSKTALERRVRFSIRVDSSDFSVNSVYINKVCMHDSIHFMYSLKWMNGIVVRTKLQSLDGLVLDYPFISRIEYVGIVKQVKSEKPSPSLIPANGKDTDGGDISCTERDEGSTKDQNEQIEVDFLHQLCFTGIGVKIAIFDAGFYNIHQIKAFENHRLTGRLWSGYDLVDMDNQLTDIDNHGTAVASCIGGYEPGKFVGSAPNAELILFRTENSATEYRIEELNWMKAAELADSMGVDLVSSSLGYTRFDDKMMNYTHADLDGRSSYVALAAFRLIQKGVLVVNSAGNSGNQDWIKIGTPADVPEILTIGAVDLQGNSGSFSSRGYNALGIIKPDVCALGVKTSIASTYGTYYKGSGTSYATPVASGAVACLIQAFPELNPSEIIEAIRQTATRNGAPDSAFGYGIMNTHAAYLYLQYKRNNFRNQPSLIDKDGDFLLFNNYFNQIEYTLYSEHFFLGFIPYKKKLNTELTESSNRFTYLQLSRDSLDCTLNYTLKLKLKSPVENCTLRYRSLSLCQR